MKKIIFLLSLLTLSFGTQSAKAWGDWGHHISAYIAEKHLTPKAKERCQHYLQHSLPHYSSWQDYWRYSPPFEAMHYWHQNFIDKDFNTIGHKGVISRDAIPQIERIVKEMGKGRYKKMNDSLVTVNLKLLIHMISDIHCPSHVDYPKDAGFKGAPIYIKGKRFGRHHFWDDSPRLLHPKWKADNFVEACDTYDKKQIKRVCKGTPSDWARENAHNMVVTYDCWEKGDDLRKMPKEQVEVIDNLVNEQLRKGAYRLAAVLNNIFKN